jgi:hypothetical protein
MIGYDNLTVITELTKRFFIRAAMNQHNLDAASSRLTLDHRLPADRVYRPHECFDREGVAEKRNAGKPGRAIEGDLRCGMSWLFRPPSIFPSRSTTGCAGEPEVGGVSIRSLIVTAIEQTYAEPRKGRPVTCPTIRPSGKPGPRFPTDENPHDLVLS